jgi:hypothetical protein
MAREIFGLNSTNPRAESSCPSSYDARFLRVGAQLLDWQLTALTGLFGFSRIGAARLADNQLRLKNERSD